jgi:hypothetical protein
MSIFKGSNSYDLEVSKVGVLKVLVPEEVRYRQKVISNSNDLRTFILIYDFNSVLCRDTGWVFKCRYYYLICQILRLVFYFAYIIEYITV